MEKEIQQKSNFYTAKKKFLSGLYPDPSMIAVESNLRGVLKINVRQQCLNHEPDTEFAVALADQYCSYA
ncbi:MAG: hypothetical protein ACTHMC_17765 [Pseudobacter sp.]|uniref:hypothetical protein n=1 Tax=Pseudobacter sp. TaxID=2045420 RepID=UPI003F822DDB